MKTYYEAPQPDTKEKRPNYALRRTGAAVVAAAGILASVKGVQAGVNYLSQNELQRHDCSVSAGKDVTIMPGASVWEDAATPLARELGIPTNEAAVIIQEANPSIADIGRVAGGTTIIVPACKK